MIRWLLFCGEHGEVFLSHAPSFDSDCFLSKNAHQLKMEKMICAGGVMGAC